MMTDSNGSGRRQSKDSGSYSEKKGAYCHGGTLVIVGGW